MKLRKIGFVSVVAGIVLMLATTPIITGFAILENFQGNFLVRLISIILMIGGVVLLQAERDKEGGLEKINLTSSIDEDNTLLRLTEAAVKNQKVQRDVDNLAAELKKGNLEPGLGKPGHIEGTDIYYLRGRNGGRLYYHQVGKNNYEIIAKSGKGRNQDRVISRIQKIYRN